jgi:HEAT repeat protein
MNLPWLLNFRRSALWVVTALSLVLLAVVIGRVMPPRHQGKTAGEWFEEAVLNVRRWPEPAGGTESERAALQACAEAFRCMGTRGIRWVVDEYLMPTPLYLKWYDQAAVALQKVVTLPARVPSNRYWESLAAHRLLLWIGPEAIPELIRRGHVRDAAQRARVVTVLGELGPGNPKAQAYLLRMLGDPSAEVIFNSLEVLWMTMPEAETAVPAIVPLLTHTNNRVRVEGSYTIGCLAPIPEPVLGTLVTLLSDSEGAVRANAARAIGLSGVRSEPIYASLEARLSDAEAVARFRAAEALVRLYGTEATNRTVALLEVLAEAERSANSYFRLIGFNMRTALGEGEWSSEAANDNFRELFAHGAAYIRSEAMAGLAFHAKTSGRPFPLAIRDLLVRAREDGNGLIRHQATRLLQTNER